MVCAGLDGRFKNETLRVCMSPSCYSNSATTFNFIARAASAWMIFDTGKAWTDIGQAGLLRRMFIIRSFDDQRLLILHCLVFLCFLPL